MSTDLLFLALGLGSGAVYAILGLGLVLEYRSSGVVNFAHGAMAMFVAYVFVQLRNQGELVFPVLGLPHVLHLASAGLSTVTALVLALAYAGVLGLVVYLLVFRSLRRTPVLGKVVATVGVMLVLQALAVLQFGSIARSTSPVLPLRSITIAGVPVPSDRLELAGLTVLLALVLWAGYRWTRFGLATRAAAENQKGALLLGYSVERLAAVNWMLATVLAGVAGILLVPITALDPNSYTLFVVPALAAALVGGFGSFWLTAGTGLAMGVAQAELIRLQTAFPSIPQQGLSDAVPLLVILVVLAVRGRGLPGRGALLEKRLPQAGHPRHLGLATGVGGCLAVLLLFALQGGYRAAVVQTMISALVCLSVVVVTGYVGQISLAQMTFSGLSGFTLAHLVGFGVPFPLSLLVAALAAVPLGLVVGLPALRLRGVQLAVITMAAAVAVQDLLFTNLTFTEGLTGAPIASPVLFGLHLDAAGNGVTFGLFVLVVLTLTALGVALLRRAPLGRRLLAIRANEQAAAACGVPVARDKLLAFGVSAFIAGLAGAVFGYQQGFLSAGSFDVFASLSFLAVAYVGGVARVCGTVVGGILATGGLLPVALNRWLGISHYDVLIAGLALIGVSIAHPDGVASAIWPGPAGALLGRLRGLLPPRAAAPVATADRTAEPPERTPTPPERTPIPPERTPVRPATATGHRPGPAGYAGERAELLRVRGMRLNFGGTPALAGADLDVPSNSLVGLIGPNGAGKTTLIDAISGFVKPSAGTVHFAGQEIRRLPPYRRVRLGLARTFQSLELFEDLTVAENLLVSATGRHRRDTVDWALDASGIAHLSEALPSELDLGPRKLVAVARALVSRPRLLLLDEPGAGLDSNTSQRLAGQLTKLRAAGVSSLLVDHDMNLVFGCCDTVTVMVFGEVIASGTPQHVLRDERVQLAYLGTAADPPAAAP